MLPDSHREQLEMKFSLGEKNYGKLAASIVGYSNEARVTKQRNKHPNYMDVDSLASGEYSQVDWQQYVENIEN